MTVDLPQLDLYQELLEVPVLDVHTHLAGGRLGAQGLHDILLYHMVVSDLYSAGCPSGARLTQFPAWPDREEAHMRLAEAIPFLPRIRNTSGWWGVRIILSDLYGWNRPITAENWKVLDDLIRERANDRAWHREILRRAGIERVCAEYARRGQGESDDVLQYSMEWGMFLRTQWGEYDTAVYDLERTWGQNPGSPCVIGNGGRPPSDRTIRTLEDVHDAIMHYVSVIPFGKVISTAMGLSGDIDYRPPTDEEMGAALQRREHAGPAERDVYAAYIGEAFLTELEKHGDKILFQFSFGAEPLPFETASRVPEKAIAQLGEIVGRHPRLNFQCMLASRHANQSLCTFCRELPNFSLAGYWWHNFFPGAIRQVIDERLDMVPLNKQVGFFSDAYVAEWTYAKAVIVKKQMADVYARKVRQGQFSHHDAMAVARAVLYETPQTLCQLKPKKKGVRRNE